MPSILMFRAVCGLSIFLGLVPLAWHWRNGNIAAICLIVWLSTTNICAFTNSFIWPDDISVLTGWEGGIYCDIQVKLMIASSAGSLGAVTAISRNLAKILSDDITVVRTKAVRKKELIQDLAMCFGIPVYMMAVHYIVQPRRYYLYTVSGCTAVVDRSWLSIVLLFIWPPIASLVAGYFACLVLVRLHRYRSQVSSILSSNSGTTRSRFFRLFILAVILLVIFIPLSFYLLYLNLNVDRLPYSWSEVHGDGWLWIKRVPTGGAIQVDTWITIGCGVLVFLLFGLGRDAVLMYREWLTGIGIGGYLPNWVMGIESASVYSPTSPRSWWSRGWNGSKVSDLERSVDSSDYIEGQHKHDSGVSQMVSLDPLVMQTATQWGIAVTREIRVDEEPGR